LVRGRSPVWVPFRTPAERARLPVLQNACMRSSPGLCSATRSLLSSQSLCKRASANNATVESYQWNLGQSPWRPDAPIIVPQGVLYEDSFLQLGLQCRYSGPRADATLFLGNKHPAAPLQPLGLALAPPASGALQLTMGQVGQPRAPHPTAAPTARACLIPLPKLIRLLAAIDFQRNSQAYVSWTPLITLVPTGATCQPLALAHPAYLRLNSASTAMTPAGAAAAGAEAAGAGVAVCAVRRGQRGAAAAAPVVLRPRRPARPGAAGGGPRLAAGRTAARRCPGRAIRLPPLGLAFRDTCRVVPCAHCRPPLPALLCSPQRQSYPTVTLIRL
jgi:hypothetical protein